jgi:hypothetical protein
MLLAALGIALVGTGYVAARRVGRQLEAAKVCGAVREGDWARALAHGEGSVGPDADGRIAAECLCWAYAASERLDDCVGLLERILAQKEAEDWVPDLALTRMLLRKQLEGGRPELAARLSTRASRAHPEDPALLELELLSRGAVDGELEVLRELAARIRGGIDATLDARVVVAMGYERQGEFAAALEVLGDEPPTSSDPEALRMYFETRASSLGNLARGDELRSLYRQWEELGGDPYELRARYAVRLSIHGLQDPGSSREDLLWKAILDEEHLRDEALHRTLYERLVGGLLVEQRIGEALEVYDRAVERFEHILISREEIQRTASASRLSDLTRPDEKRAIEFRLPDGAPPGELLLSPPLDGPADGDYERLRIRPGGKARARRVPGAFPFRWVYRDGQGRALASGSTWADRPHNEIAIEPRAPRPVEFEAPVQPPGDGRRRVFVVIPDCEDWRLIQYLRARGELPMHDWLLARGRRAVLESVPAFTGAAMESLVWPRKLERATFVGALNRIGLEVAGLASVGRNPLGFLAPVLPEAESIFERVGAGEHVALNLLFSHGQVDAGRNAELVGPRGQRSRLEGLRAARPLRADEAQGLPVGLQALRYAAEVHKMAAGLDAAVELAKAGRVDLLLLRIEPLDILTHGFFTELMRPMQDDGEPTLLWAYRYIDRRLREVAQALDADDVLIVMSDHGIRTALEHDEDAFFVAVGSGISHGRVPGQPHLRGVPQLLAALLGVPADWPETGLVAGIAPSQLASR